MDSFENNGAATKKQVIHVISTSVPLGYDNPGFESASSGHTGVKSTTIETRLCPTQSTSEKLPPTRPKRQKDSGYAWLILVLGTLTCIAFSNGKAIMGVLLLELGQSFDASAVELNAAATLSHGVLMCSSLFSGLFVTRFGSRITVIIGSLLATSAYVATSFAPNIYVIIFSYGIVSGVAFGFMQMGAFFAITEYFDKYMGLAMGVFTSGYSISPFVWPPVVSVLFSHYGWRGSFMILAGIQLNICIVGALMTPVQKDKNSKEGDGSTPQGSYLQTQSKVFSNKHFVAYCGTIFFVQAAYVYAYAYVPTLAVNIGTTKSNASLLVTIMGVTSAVSCVMFGCIGDAPWFRNNRLVICIVGYALNGIDKILSIKATTYTHLALYAVADGVTFGAHSSMFYTIVTDVVELEQQGLAGGIAACVSGFAVVLGNSVAGWLYSYFGSLDVPSVVMGCMQILGSLGTILLYINIKCNGDHFQTTVTRL